VESGHSTSTLGASPSSCRTLMMTFPGVPPSGSDRRPRWPAVIQHHDADDPGALRDADGLVCRHLTAGHRLTDKIGTVGFLASELLTELPGLLDECGPPDTNK
jgi:hypothetical protein